MSLASGYRAKVTLLSVIRKTRMHPDAQEVRVDRRASAYQCADFCAEFRAEMMRAQRPSSTDPTLFARKLERSNNAARYEHNDERPTHAKLRLSGHH